ncbi:MAG TPA: phosphatidylserine decarboxylase family protein [Symbiobacteriaceae bacterium]|nr:phosphatidylserine decarboxylase family protein [Symbiobacteriaceae bacterium]
MNRPIIAREGWVFIAFLAVVTAVAGVVHWALAILPGLLLALCLWFFRDPERPLPGNDLDVVSPADGRVMFVREVEEPRFIGGKAVMVSIFLSVFDVHINRMPVGGTIGYKEYVGGKFLAAWDETVGEVNERSYLGVDTGRHKVLVSQVAGLIARRILTWPVVGDRLSRGERFGLIRFGSCTQLWLPAGSTVLVKPGDRVQGSSTLIGRLPS